MVENMACMRQLSYGDSATCVAALIRSKSVWGVTGTRRSADGVLFEAPTSILRIRKSLVGSGAPFSLCTYAKAEMCMATVAGEAGLGG